MCVWISTEVVCLHCYSTIWLLQVKLLLSCAPFVYTMQPVFIVTSHKATYIWCMCVCMLWSGSQIINVIIMLFCCNLPPALLEERPGSLICYCSNTGVEQVPNWESAQKVDPGEENSHATSAWFEPVIFFIMNLALYHWVCLQSPYLTMSMLYMCASFPTLFVFFSIQSLSFVYFLYQWHLCNQTWYVLDYY